MTRRDRETEAMLTQLLPTLKRPGDGLERPLIKGILHVGLVLDTALGTSEVGPVDLERWSLTWDQAYEIALTNLRARSDVRRWQDVDTVPGMRFYLPGTTEASARALVLLDLVDPWPAEGVVFTVPTPNQLLAIPLYDFEALEAIRVLVTSTHLTAKSAVDPLSDQVFWFDGHAFHRFDVHHGDDEVEMMPPDGFLDVVERLASIGMVTSAAEA